LLSRNGVFLIAQFATARLVVFHLQASFFDHFFQFGHAVHVVFLDSLDGALLPYRWNTRVSDHRQAITAPLYYTTYFLILEHLAAVFDELLLDGLATLASILSGGQGKSDEDACNREFHGDDWF
jgi:hypothetical protein